MDSATILPKPSDHRPRIAIIGTHDTKGDEIAWITRRVSDAGCSAITIDPGTFSPVGAADIGADSLARRAGSEIDDLRTRSDRGHAIAVLAQGTEHVVTELAAAGTIHGVLAIGGSGGSALAAPALQALPVGFPKLLVSTMTSGDVRAYVGASDITLMYSVTDIAGLNSVSEAVLGNAVAAIAGMATAFQQRESTGNERLHRPVVAMTMFGVTTPAADEARTRLEGHGYEVIVFHATGSGGRAMEKLISSGAVTGVCDLTTTELCDEMLGGVLSAGPHRLEAAGQCGIPQVISVGALDMVNFGPPDTVPERYADRRFLHHNPMVTLMRTTAQEMSELGLQLAQKAAMGAGPTTVFLPLAGVSSVDVPGQPFHDPTADESLFESIRTGLTGTHVMIEQLPMSINDPGFGAAMADRLHSMISASSRK